MLRRFPTICCTLLAAGLMAAVGGTLHAEKIEQVSARRSVACTQSPCTTEECATAAPASGCSSGCTDSACASGCGTSCGLFGGHGKHSWRHASCCHTGCGHQGLLARHRAKHYIEGLDPHFNCGCNGSYNFPVPPLYTYMWPGMYKHQLMTEYDNPWRFPPIKAYVDEPNGVIPEVFRKDYPEKELPLIIEVDDDLTSIGQPRIIHPVSAQRPLPSRNYGGRETMSQKMERYYGSSNR